MACLSGIKTPRRRGKKIVAAEENGGKQEHPQVTVAAEIH